MLIGFLVNPVAGMGGRVGLKGTDGVAGEALARGAVPASPGRAVEALAALRAGGGAGTEYRFLTCAGMMGEEELRGTGYSPDVFEVVHSPGGTTTAADTAAACRAFAARGAHLILFCGGDGTARDILKAVGSGLPVVGIPAGVKMHSGVFGVNPASAARLVGGFIEGEVEVGDGEVMDLDEGAFRRGEWRIALHGTLRTLQDPALLQSGKALFEPVQDGEVRREIAATMAEEMAAERDTLFILGPGTTVEAVAKEAGLTKTLLGVDGVAGGKVVAADADEQTLLDHMDRYGRVRIVLSPVGAQGFILGRGNLVLSPAVVRRAGGVAAVSVISTPAKLARTPLLRVDSGEPGLDAEFAAKGYLLVLVGYRTRRMVPVAR